MSGSAYWAAKKWISSSSAVLAYWWRTLAISTDFVRVTPSSSRSSRARACSNVSAERTLPPGNSHLRGEVSPRRRWPMRIRRSGRSITAATTWSMEGTKFRSKSVTMQSDEERSSLRCKASSDQITAIRKQEWCGLTGTASWKIWRAGQKRQLRRRTPNGLTLGEGCDGVRWSGMEDTREDFGDCGWDGVG